MGTVVKLGLRQLEHDRANPGPAVMTSVEKDNEHRLARLEQDYAVLAARVTALEEALARYFAAMSRLDHRHRNSIDAALDGPEAEWCADSAAYFLGRIQSLYSGN